MFSLLPPSNLQLHNFGTNHLEPNVDTQKNDVLLEFLDTNLYISRSNTQLLEHCCQEKRKVLSLAEAIRELIRQMKAAVNVLSSSASLAPKKSWSLKEVREEYKDKFTNT